MTDFPQLAKPLRRSLHSGLVIPAHPLALDRNRKFDERHQRALTRYYRASGAGGIAVGVHTTQFAIRERKHGLLRPVLELAAETLNQEEGGKARMVRVAGICGRTAQAVREAELARELGYHVGLMSLSALPRASVAGLIRHAEAVAAVLPIMGFYLQPAVGGRVLPYAFWRELAEIPNLCAIKVAPFNRYQTLDVVRAVADAGRTKDIALYTGNDDNIIADLVTPFPVRGPKKPARIVGGLLGHWAVWTRRAVDQLRECQRVTRLQQLPIPTALLGTGVEVTDANSAIFDAANGFAGCIPGIHEVLYRQGLLASRHCLDPNETLSRGQKAEIDRVCAMYPHLHDDAFVKLNLEGWLAA